MDWFLLIWRQKGHTLASIRIKVMIVKDIAPFSLVLCSSTNTLPCVSSGLANKIHSIIKRSNFAHTFTPQPFLYLWQPLTSLHFFQTSGWGRYRWEETPRQSLNRAHKTGPYWRARLTSCRDCESIFHTHACTPTHTRTLLQYVSSSI